LAYNSVHVIIHSLIYNDYVAFNRDIRNNYSPTVFE